MIRKFADAIACVAAAALAAAVLAGCGESSDAIGGKPPNYERALAGAPKPLADLYADGNRLLPGGTEAFESRLADLRGYPVVVNKWASWCGPCREEFPHFQRLSAQLGKRVAFIGVDADDTDAAETFLEEFPVPYPSYTDPDEDLSRQLGATVGFPATVFYDADGQRVFVKQGQYATQADLAADIRRYALENR